MFISRRVRPEGSPNHPRLEWRRRDTFLFEERLWIANFDPRASQVTTCTEGAPSNDYEFRPKIIIAIREEGGEGK